MSSFAVYRLPHTEMCTLVRQTGGQPEELAACCQLNSRAGFVLAPFHISQDTPLLLIRPDVVEQAPVDSVADWEPLLGGNGMAAMPADGDAAVTVDGREAYRQDFSRFLRQLSSGMFQKLVLSRSTVAVPSRRETPLQLFVKACRRYPRLFVCLVYTPASGMWLAATPEILLEEQGGRWRTIALAGTMELKGEGLKGEGERVTWCTKNIQEQRYVATYLAEQLKPFAGQLREEGPRTVRAAHLVHLRSDFTFTLYNNARVGDLLDALHPTPAVCGLPKQQAFDWIRQNEHAPRRYYSGFMGPLLLGGDTHLYVSLRCMQIGQHGCRLYAGGGLLPESVEEQEWEETEAKMATMRQLLEEE